MGRHRKTSPKFIKNINFDDYRDMKVNLVTAVTKADKKPFKHDINFRCAFDYLAEKFSLECKSKSTTFIPISMKVLFRQQSLGQFNYKTAATNKVIETVTFARHNIDFFGFSNERIFNIILTAKQTNKKLQIVEVESTYKITLPVIHTTDLFFKAPGTTYPDESFRRICKQQFQMKSHNSNDEINRCILLEEFRLMSKTLRYKVYGFAKMLNWFIDIENSFELDLLQKFDINNVELKSCSATHYKIVTAGHIPTAAASVRLTPMNALFASLDKKQLQEVQVQAPITNYHFRHVIIEINRKNLKKVKKDDRYRVEFRPNFYSNAMAQRALNRIVDNGYETFMIDFEKSSLPKKSKLRFPTFKSIEWMNKDVGSNFAQTQAIQHIVNRTSYPSPYIVFGPPGTGKTSTLVEAVSQIVKLQPASRVLITVNSNSACDEIGDRMLTFVGANKMYRFYSPSFAKKMERVNPKLKVCSNLRYNYHVQPSVQELTSYNVVICTLVNSGRMKSLGTHFDYIFIDECASSAEPYVAIPMTLAMKKGQDFKASIVLLGDPKQLGQIMRTHHSERYGFNVSLMERVMELAKYSFGKKGFNPNFIVQLTDNFRSHRAILDFSNKEFYNSILNAKQKENVANFAIGWKLLPNPKVPLMFRASWTPSESDGTSLVNSGDIAFVKMYVGNLLNNGINGKTVKPGDIGIICPYAAQRERLKLIYTNGIEIGTVEYFQGREKLIIIVSSVRSETPTVGFLKNEKRLNVALTRAKALLIVIGNPATLGKNRFWRHFIVGCCENKATVGKIPGWIYKKSSSAEESEKEEDEDEVIRLEEMMNGMNMED